MTPEEQAKQIEADINQPKPEVPPTPRQQIEADIAQATQVFEQAKAQANAQDGYIQGLKRALALLPEK